MYKWNIFDKYLPNILVILVPPFWPLKVLVSKNGQPSTTYDPTFLFQNPLLLQKLGCLPKTEPNTLKIDQDMKNKLENLDFFSWNKKHHRLKSVQDF